MFRFSPGACLSKTVPTPEAPVISLFVFNLLAVSLSASLLVAPNPAMGPARRLRLPRRIVFLIQLLTRFPLVRIISEHKENKWGFHELVRSILARLPRPLRLLRAVLPHGRGLVTRCLSIWLPDLPIDRVRRGAPEPKAAAVWASVGAARRIVCVDGAARARGIEPGTTLAAARAMAPDLALIEADPGADEACLSAVLAWSRRYTPLAAFDRPDGLMLDVAGATHLFGGEEALAADVERRLLSQGFRARVGLADSPELAWALARWSERRIAAAGLSETELARIAAPLPLAALRLSPGQVDGLAQAGLRRIGDILHRPRAPVAARWGRALFDRLDGMLGRIKSALSPVFETPACLAERTFAEPIARREDAEAAIASLARELCVLLDRRGEGLRRVEASFFRVDGAVKTLEVGTSRPLREPDRIARLFRERLEALGDDGLDAGLGFDLARLSALELERLDPRQSALAPTDAPHLGAQDLDGPVSQRQDSLGQGMTAQDFEDDLRDLIDRLSARLGARRVLRLSARASHIPEEAVVETPYAFARRRTSPRLAASAAALAEDETATRPLRLLDRPERIEAIAGVPDGPPLRFRWRRAMHDVVAVEGPERIAPDWRRRENPGLTRDYFRVEDAEGRRFWLCRCGLYGTETERPEWFLHGFFG